MWLLFVASCNEGRRPIIIGYTDDLFPLYDQIDAASYVVFSEAIPIVELYYQDEWRRFDYDYSELGRSSFPYAVLSDWIKDHFVYMTDPPGGYWKTPAETWADGGGDCEDFAILMAAMLRVLGCHHDLYLSRGFIYDYENCERSIHVWLSIRFIPDENGDIFGFDFDCSPTGVFGFGIYSPSLNPNLGGYEGDPNVSLRQSIVVPQYTP